MKHTVTEYKLECGAQGLVVDVPGSDVVCMQVRFNSGFQFADPDRYEVPHVMEHLLATVTRRHPGPNEFIIEAQKNGAYVNALTSGDVNGYVYECARFELDRVLDLVEEQITQPLFAETAFRAEVGNVREELTRNTTQHGAVCAIALAQAVFPEQWKDYDRRLEQLAAIELGDLERHYSQTHTARNGRFYVAGDFGDRGAEMAARFERIFGQLAAGERLARSRAIGQAVKRPVVIRREIGQLYYRMGMYFGELDRQERRALSCLRMVLAGGMGARVLGEARRRGLAYAISAVGHAEQGNSSFGFGGYVTPGNAEALFELVRREFEAVGRGEVSQKEVRAAQDLLVGSVTRSTQTAGDMLGWYLDSYDESGEILEFERELALVRTVRPEAVAGVAQKAAAGRWGQSFVGDLDEAKAEFYQSLVQA